MVKPTAKASSAKQFRLTCTFRVEHNSSLLRLLEFLKAEWEGKPPRDLFLEAADFYWKPMMLLAERDANQLSEEQFRRQALHAITRLEAWVSYCRQVTGVDPTPTVIHHQQVLFGTVPNSSTPMPTIAIPDAVPQPSPSTLDESPAADNPFTAGRRSTVHGDLFDTLSSDND